MSPELHLIVYSYNGVKWEFSKDEIKSLSHKQYSNEEKDFLFSEFGWYFQYQEKVKIHAGTKTIIHKKEKGYWLDLFPEHRLLRYHPSHRLTTNESEVIFEEDCIALKYPVLKGISQYPFVENINGEFSYVSDKVFM